MIHTWRLNREEYKRIPLRDRMVADMLSEMAEVDFSNKVIDIIVKRYPTDIHCWDYSDNDKGTIDHMRTTIESGINAYCAIKELYESEYGKMSDELEKGIHNLSNGLAEKILVLRGWKKEEVSV